MAQEEQQQQVVPRPPGPLRAHRYTTGQYKRFLEVFFATLRHELEHDVRMRIMYLHFLDLAADYLEKRIETAEWVELVRDQQILRFTEDFTKRLHDRRWSMLLAIANYLAFPLNDLDKMRMEVLVKWAEDSENARSPDPEVYFQQIHQTVVEELDQAQELVSRIKARFQERNEESLYKAFLHNLTAHKTGEQTAYEVIHNVTTMFQTEHADFLHDFRNFLQI